MPITQRIPSVFLIEKLAVKKIYEPDKMTYDEEKLLDEGINAQLRKVNGLSPIERKTLGLTIDRLIDAEQKKERFKMCKEGVGKFGLDPKKVFRSGL